MTPTDTLNDAPALPLNRRAVAIIRKLDSIRVQSYGNHLTAADIEGIVRAFRRLTASLTSAHASGSDGGEACRCIGCRAWQGIYQATVDGSENPVLWRAVPKIHTDEK